MFADLEGLRVFCDAFVPTVKACTLVQAVLTYRWPAGVWNVVGG
jgi:hypothetical protein